VNLRDTLLARRRFEFWTPLAAAEIQDRIDRSVDHRRLPFLRIGYHGREFGRPLRGRITRRGFQVTLAKHGTMVWATGQLLPEREGTLVQVVVALPTASTISFVAFSALFLTLWLSPDVGVLARATGLSAARLLSDLLAIVIVALIIRQVYRHELSDADALGAPLRRLLADPAEPSSGSPAVSRNVPAAGAQPVRKVLMRLGQGLGSCGSSAS
jgi:hypothetical protein